MVIQPFLDFATAYNFYAEKRDVMVEIATAVNSKWWRQHLPREEMARKNSETLQRVLCGLVKNLENNSK